MTVGDTMIGLCLSLALVPLLSELIEVLEAQKRFDSHQLSDMTSALFNCMFNLGNLLSPLAAGLLTDRYGYKVTTDVMMIASLAYSFVLLGVLGVKR